MPTAAHLTATAINIAPAAVEAMPTGVMAMAQGVNVQPALVRCDGEERNGVCVWCGLCFPPLT